MFRKISPDEFDDLLAAAPASPAFRQEFARYEFRHDRRYIDAAVQDGALHVEAPLRVPAFYTLVIGDLDVEGEIDLRSDYEAGGLFVVLGNVRCRHFVSEYDAAVFIDGDLRAEGAALVAYSDSSFSVVGTMHARLLIGNDICASVGDGAVIDYGEGYCASMGSDGASGIVRPRHDSDATIQALTPELQHHPDPLDVETLAAHIRAGKSIFR